MKILIYTFLVFLTSLPLTAQRIQNAAFAEAIKWQCPDCIDTAQNLTPKASQITSITLSNKIDDIEGISRFVSLTNLNISDNELKSLPPLPPNLKTLRCSHNKLTQLPNLPASLTTLVCNFNFLTTLPPLPKTLKLLNCSDNQLTFVPELPRTVETFYCSYNNIVVLPLLPAVLAELGCAHNQITEIPSLPSNVVLLSCFNNPLLKCLPTLPDSMKYLEISPTINCLPNQLKFLTVFEYLDSTFTIVKRPICTRTCAAITPVNDPDLDASIRLFPTYTEGVFNIETSLDNIKKVEIINALGHIVATFSFITQMDISRLPTSMYWVKIHSVDDKIAVKKIVKL